MPRTRSSLIALATGGILAAAAFTPTGANAAPGNPCPGQSCKVTPGKAPKNVIVMIGDGMGYNSIAQAAMYKSGGLGKGQAYSVGPGLVHTTDWAKPGLSWQTWPSTDMTTYASNGSYDPKQAWADYNYVKKNPTDSSAAGTAMASGQKTYNGAIGVDLNKVAMPNIRERAEQLGKATGVVSSVPFSHATPASWVAHNPSRNDYKGIAAEMVASDAEVIIGAGHPAYDDGHKKLAAPKYTYISEADFTKVSTGQTGFSYVEDKAGFEKLAKDGKNAPERVFGLPQVGSTLQQGRPGETKDVKPFSVPMNDVPNLSTLSTGALNVLNKDKDGFFVMIEGGAIDWAGHGNENTRNVEETLDFDRAVESVVDWVNKNSNWNETVLIVTADHETGYLSGPGSNPLWTRMTPKGQGQLPEVMWHSGDHTNQLVPVFFKGAAGQYWMNAADLKDPVRGKYLDNTDIANVNFGLWANAKPGK